MSVANEEKIVQKIKMTAQIRAHQRASAAIKFNPFFQIWSVAQKNRGHVSSTCPQNILKKLTLFVKCQDTTPYLSHPLWQKLQSLRPETPFFAWQPLQLPWKAFFFERARLSPPWQSTQVPPPTPMWWHSLQSLTKPLCFWWSKSTFGIDCPLNESWLAPCGLLIAGKAKATINPTTNIIKTIFFIAIKSFSQTC